MMGSTPIGVKFGVGLNTEELVIRSVLDLKMFRFMECGVIEFIRMINVLLTKL